MEKHIEVISSEMNCIFFPGIISISLIVQKLVSCTDTKDLMKLEKEQNVMDTKVQCFHDNQEVLE